MTNHCWSYRFALILIPYILATPLFRIFPDFLLLSKNHILMHSHLTLPNIISYQQMLSICEKHIINIHIQPFRIWIYIYGWQYTHPMISCMETSYDPILFPYASQPCPCRHINAFRPRIAPVGAPPPFCTAFGVTCSRKNQGVLWAKQNQFRENMD